MSEQNTHEWWASTGGEPLSDLLFPARGDGRRGPFRSDRSGSNARDRVGGERAGRHGGRREPRSALRIGTLAATFTDDQETHAAVRWPLIMVWDNLAPARDIRRPFGGRGDRSRDRLPRMLWTGRAVYTASRRRHVNVAILLYDTRDLTAITRLNMVVM